MVAVTNLLSKYTVLCGKVMTLVVTIQSVARRWTANNNTVSECTVSECTVVHTLPSKRPLNKNPCTACKFERVSKMLLHVQCTCTCACTCACAYYCMQFPTQISVHIPYSWKYWRELNLAVGSQIAKVLADFNLAVQYGIAILIYASKKFWQILIWRLLR